MVNPKAAFWMVLYHYDGPTHLGFSNDLDGWAHHLVHPNGWTIYKHDRACTHKDINF
jgi:hypothetical protein